MNIDHKLLASAREAYLRLLDLYRPLDAQISAAEPNWDPQDHFCTHLAALCADTALVMLGADHELSEPELVAFNTLFALHETPQSLASMAEWISQREVAEAEFFNRLDRFMLSSSLVDARSGSQRTLEVLDFFKSLGQLVALIDERYHQSEDHFYRQLCERIEASWQQVDNFVHEAEPALVLDLRNGSQSLYRLA
ncbi:MAG: hypothetical protein CVV27_09370 [Candidatus Melainabacteria bacterium HGW-Melainabacteria-1]|nr:MAG: hypothetical protein CVV27_09370 [Candidatus Melainabacteria bacterium HGW-Melainabacteria-1]